MGKPSVFLRLQGCNLMCGGNGTERDKELHDGATWRCDTIEVWLKGDGYDPQSYAMDVVDNYYGEFHGGSQLVITGGEPLMQQSQLIPFINILRRQGQSQAGNPHIRIEVETNGTVELENNFTGLIDQFNVSPKLANSGMPERRRIKDEPLTQLAALSHLGQSIFKFVITHEDDVEEMFRDYIDPFSISIPKVYLMPGCSTREEFERNGPLVAELCKEFGFQFSSRLQINLWNQTTGV